MPRPSTWPRCLPLLAALIVLAPGLASRPEPALAAAPDAAPPGARAFTIARLKYGGGGDWYEDRTSLSNLLKALRERMSTPVASDHEATVEPASAAIFQYPFVFACGHGNIKF